jgi:hypothetical protein
MKLLESGQIRALGARALDQPVRCREMQGMWWLPADVHEVVQARLDPASGGQDRGVGV